jgi:hypothetical protein
MKHIALGRNEFWRVRSQNGNNLIEVVASLVGIQLYTKDACHTCREKMIIN